VTFCDRLLPVGALGAAVVLVAVMKRGARACRARHKEMRRSGGRRLFSF
jgi:hypothetical protein